MYNKMSDELYLEHSSSLKSLTSIYYISTLWNAL